MVIKKRKIGVFAVVLLIFAFVVSSVVISLGNTTAGANASVDAVNLSLRSTDSLELLLDGYENISGKNIFNSSALEKLYSKIVGSGATFDDVATASNTSKLGTAKGQMHKGLDSNEIRRNNGGSNVVISLAGLEWTVTSLTQDEFGNVVLTLWLNEGLFSSKFNDWMVNVSYDYPSTMYSSSKIRAALLNGVDSSGNEVKYVKKAGDTELSSIEKMANYPFNAFTLNTTVNSDNSINRSNGSITDFIVKPKNIPYMLTENMRDLDVASIGNGLYSSQNDAAARLDDSKWRNDSNIKIIQDKKGYYDWSDDYLWLPSWVETGFGAGSDFKGGGGLWNTDPALRSSNGTCWLRSMETYDYTAGYPLEANGIRGYARVDTEYYVRPALHLNLTKADAASAITIPNAGKNSDITKFAENGSEVTFKLNSVVDDKLEVEITATDRNGANLTYSKSPSVSNGVLSFTASVAGTYTVKVTPNDGEIWSDGTNEAKTYTYKLKEPITPLTWKTSGEEKATKTYNGKTQYFVLENYDENEMNVSPAPVKIPDGETDAGKWAIAVKDVADTTITATLKDTNFAGWSDGNAYDNTSAGQRSLSYKMNAKALTATASGAWSTQVSTSDTTYDVYIDVFDGDIASIEFECYYSQEGGAEKKTVAPTVVKDGDNRAKVTVTLPELSVKGNYLYSIKLKSGTATNKNYTLTFNKAFTVDNKKLEINSDDVVWRYTNSKVGAGYQTVGELDSNGIFNVEYNGAAFTFDVDTDAMSKDADYKVEGEKSATVVKLNGTAIEYYTATLKITPKEGVDFENKEFTLKWRINKAKFDLTNVKWNYNADNPKHFNDKEQEVVMTGIPDGLTFNYINNKKRLMGSYKAEVTSITVRSDLKNNYITPDIKNADTYKGNVAWSLDWQIKKGELELDWIPKQEKDVNDKIYSSWESDNYSDKIEYKYYTVEAYADGELTGDPIDKASIIVPDEETEIQYYIVAVVKESFASNYEIVGTWSMPFIVGSLATVININMASEFTYDGASHGKEWYNVSVAGMEYVSAEYFVVEEDGSETSLGDAVPTDAGSYIVRLSLDIDYITSYQLSKAKLNYTIVKAQIEISLTNGEYDYDEAGHAGEFSITGGNYDISKITKTYYKGTTKDFLLPAGDLPCNAGDYIVALSLPVDDNRNYEITSDVEFSIKINKAKITVKWINDDKGIPSLSELSDSQKAKIGYVYYDSDGNPLADGAMLEVGKSYKVKAILTGNYGDNYEFVAEDGETVLEDTAMTDAQDFTVKNNNGQGGNVGVGDGDNNGDGGGNSIKAFFDKLIASHFPLWQIATIAVSALLALIFMIKAIQYGNRARQAKGEAKKIKSKAYAALLPIFSTDVVALGLTNQIWSIIAFALVGLALLMLVIAIITRASWKKAERVKETAYDDREERRREDERRERREFQERVVQSSAGGSADTSFLEKRLLEMEERHQRELEAREARYREEQTKRDDAMKAMLAGIMGSRNLNDDDMIYGTLDDTDMLVQRVIAGLLPSIQQMIPEPTAYLTAPGESHEELQSIIEAQNAQMQAMSDKMDELQAQLASVHEIADAVIMPDNNDEIKAMTDEMNALRQQIDNLSKGGATAAVASDNSELITKMNQMQQQIAMLAQSQFDNSVLDDYDDEDMFDDDEEEWDSILDEDEDDNFVESVIIEADGTVRKVSPNFRMRLKESSEQNREWYAAIKNLFCSQKGVTYRVCKRVEKIRYQGQIIGVIGIAKRSIKLWLALKPYEYDARRYHHKDVSDKPRFVDVPLYVRVGSDRALTRAQELILALFQDFNMEARKRYNDRDIQELIFTLKHNKLLTNKQYKRALCQIIHIHDCNVLDDETAQKCIEFKNVDFIDDGVIETVKLDDIDAYFQDGNRVTLEKLRKVGLVSEGCTGYNVVADKRLTKPLIIVANDFTLPAVKMIALTGGRVIKLSQV